MKKVFITLITIVALVVVGTFVLNVIMPNTVTTMVNTVEGMVFNATGLSMDFNGDGDAGNANTVREDQEIGNADIEDNSGAESGQGVEGFGGN